MAAKSFMFLRNTVERTTFPRPLPAASRISDKLRRTRSVCAATSPVTTCCVAGSIAICPEVKINPLALMACEYGPMACGASLVEMISRIGSSQFPVASSQRTEPQRAQSNTEDRPSVVILSGAPCREGTVQLAGIAWVLRFAQDDKSQVCRPCLQ